MQNRKRIVCGHALVVAAALACAAAAVAAPPVAVEAAWLRAPAPGQNVAGAYLDITSRVPATLIAVESPAAGRVELHTMSMDDGVMRMRPLARIDLPAGKTVKLKPGGHHLMLMDIKRPLNAGDRVALTLTVQDRKKVKSTIDVQAEVRPLAAAAADHSKHR